MATGDTYATLTGQVKPKTPKPTAFQKEVDKPLKNVISPAQIEKQVAGHQRVAHQDGHAVNEHYKIPSARPGGGTNLSYMHPHVQPISMSAIQKSADKALSETHRPGDQMGRSKTVFPVNQEKVRGAPKQPANARPSRVGGSHPIGMVPRASGQSNIF